MLIQTTEIEKQRLNQKQVHNIEWVNTIDGLATITKKMYIIHRKFCVVLLMLYLSQIKLH